MTPGKSRVEMVAVGLVFLAIVFAALLFARMSHADPSWSLIRIGAIGAPEVVLPAGTRTYRWHPEKTGAALKIWNGTAFPCKSAGGTPIRVGHGAVWTGSNSKGACLSPEAPGLVYYR